VTTLPMLTTDQAYQAMIAFLDAYWNRGGRTDDQIAILLGGMAGGRGHTADPAMWGDWIKAIEATTDFKLLEL